MSIPSSSRHCGTDVVQGALATACAQYDFMLEHLGDRPGFPRSFDQGRLVLAPASDWTSGFFAGSLWYLFEATGEDKWRAAAQRYMAPLEPMKLDRSTHDVGFILYCSFGNAWRLTHDAHCRDVLLQGAASLASRYNLKVGCIKSWDWNPEWSFPVIIDNMLNLEMLLWAAREGGNQALREIAVTHAETTLANHFRPDCSCYHVVNYDGVCGSVAGKFTHQGLHDDSSWARGQAWALYGFTLMYRETRTPAFLQQAQRVAQYILNHPRLPADLVPYWDFDAAPDPATPRDSSAAAAICSALLELSDYAEPGLAPRFREAGNRLLISLCSPDYLASPGENGGFLLKHATGHMPCHSEVDAPLVYGDYYFLEALLRASRQQRTSE